MSIEEENIVLKIKNIFKVGYENGIPYSTTLGFITEDFKGYQDKNAKNLIKIGNLLKQIFFNEKLTMQTVKKFIKSSDIDMHSLIDEIEKERRKEKENNFIEDVNIKERGEIKMKEELEETVMSNKEIDELEDVELEEPEIENKTEAKVDEDVDKNSMSPKALKLEEKINELCKKLEKEENIFKKHINMFKLKNLSDRLQQEIDKQNIHKKYDLLREGKDRKKEIDEKDLLTKINQLEEEMKYYKNYLRSNREYNISSKDFIYPKNYVERLGGIEELQEKLKSTDKTNGEYAAKKIQEVEETKKKLKSLQKKLSRTSETLDGLDEKYDKYERKYNKEEKSLIIAKNNPFNRIKGWFKNAFGQINEFFEERKENKELSKQEKQEIKEMQEEYRKMAEEQKGEIKKYTEEQKKSRNHQKLREFQEKSGIKVSKEQLENNEEVPGQSSVQEVKEQETEELVQ